VERGSESAVCRGMCRESSPPPVMPHGRPAVDCRLIFILHKAAQTHYVLRTMWLTRERWRAMVNDPLCPMAVESRRYVASSVQELRDTPYIKRDYARSTLLRKVVMGTALDTVPLAPPYDPEGTGCFLTPSRRWPKLVRLREDPDMIVHKDMKPLLLAVHDLCCMPPAMKYRPFMDRLNFVRRATKLFLSLTSDVATEIVPTGKPVEESPKSLPRPVISDLGRDGLSMDGDSQRPSRQTVDLSDLSTSRCQDPQVVLPVVGAVTVGMGDHEPSQVRDRPPKKQHMKPNPQTSRKPHRKRRVAVDQHP
jgi:hypothetical protein